MGLQVLPEKLPYRLRNIMAQKVVVTGRNEEKLKELLALGLMTLLYLNRTMMSSSQIKALHQQSPFDVVIDYLWGHSAELILSAIKGNGGFSHRTRYVTVGGMMNDNMTLSSSILRSTDIQISGSGREAGHQPK